MTLLEQTIQEMQRRGLPKPPKEDTSPNLTV